MTTVAVFADPPEQTEALSGLVDAGVLDADEATRLYTAALCDTCLAVARSGGDLLVNYRSLDGDDEAAQSAVESAIAPVFESTEEVRFEVQVGSSHSARVGNTVTHLLDTEGVTSAAVVDPVVTLLERRHVDSAAMKLRQSEVVLGPSAGGRPWYVAFTEPVDFTAAFDSLALRTLAERGRKEGFDVDFVETLPVLDSRRDLAGSIVQIQARAEAEKYVPPYVTAAIDGLGLQAVETADGFRVERD